MHYLFRSFIVIIKRICVSVMYIFPIQKNKIVFLSFNGKQKSCNPLYIYKKLLEKYPDTFDIYWVYDGETQDRKDIKYRSLHFLYHAFTAGCVVSNDIFMTYMAFRKKQLVINTWHGGGLFKRIFGKNHSEAEERYIKLRKDLQNRYTSLYISSSKIFTKKIIQGLWGYRGEILECGMPRNDLFFGNTEPIAHKVKSFFGIPDEDGMVLYAPTFRVQASHTVFDVQEKAPLDIQMLLSALSTKYGKKFHFVFRSHHTFSVEIPGTLNASDYPDMQELLVAAEVFLSDYSSCLWDYSLTYRPCFIYAPDIEQYAINPGFESDYRQWPFPIAKSNEELCANIQSFDAGEYKQRVVRYHEEYGSYEKGNAAEIIVEKIHSRLVD